jgi:hypothetical protein
MATYAEQMQALHQRYRIEVSATANDQSISRETTLLERDLECTSNS